MPSHRLSLWLAGACAAALALAAGPSEAAACSCAGIAVAPPRGATDVPRNAVVTLHTRFPDGLALREAGSRELVETDVAERELLDGWRLVTLTPAAALTAGTDYEVVFVDGEGANVVSQFSAGDALDDEAPAAPTVEGLSAEVRAGDGLRGNSCLETPGGYFGRLRFDLAATLEDVAYATVSARAADGAATLAPVMWSVNGAAVQLQTTTCEAPFPDLVPGDSYCATLALYDLAGNSSSSEEICTTVIECAPEVNEYGEPSARCRPVDGSGPQQAAADGCALAGGSPGLGAVWLLAALAALARRRVRRP